MIDARGGAEDLAAMLATMSVSRRPGAYTIVSVVDRAELPDDLTFEALVREDEGWTVVCNADDARRCGFVFDYVAAWLTLDVHSSLDAVGLTAAISQALASHGMSCNVIAAAFHDHLLVALDEADRAIEVLEDLRHGARGR